jgi:Beta-ketoacyl synthase, C-terminal domain
VNYINAHATSTLVGDLAEVNAVKQVFKDLSEIKINGTKVSSLSNPVYYYYFYLMHICFYMFFFISFLYTVFDRA